MVKIPTMEDSQFTTTYLLNEVLVEDGKRSQRLGMAGLGEPCVRRMWLGFRWAHTPNKLRRIKRLFGFGDAVETLVIKDLEEIGITVTDQQKWVNGWGGHIAGRIDGIAHNVPEAPKTPHLLEVKSMNDRNFQAFCRDGLVKTNFKHYVQMIMYMGELKLARGLYIAMNKNDSKTKAERVYFNNQHYKEYKSRAIDVVSHEIMPPNLFNDPKSQACRFCDFTHICYEKAKLQKSCRSCVKCDIEDNGKWSCSLLKKQLTYEDQVAACNFYKAID